MNEEPVDKTEEPEMPVTEEKQTKIVVSNLPSSVHDEYLEMFFENTRKGGGGPVFHVDIDEENGTAIVEFEEPEAVDIVLNKCPIKMMGQEVEVTVYKPEPPVPRCTIEVTGPCSIVCEKQLETLEMYFENFRRSGGGEVVECRFDEENNMVLVTFENEEVALRVEERVGHVIKKEKLNVALHVPTKQSKKSDKVKKEDKEDEPEPTKTIKVKGVDKSASRDTVEFYFENSRRSGGGEIENISSDEEEEDVIYITFKNRKDAESIVRKGHHQVEGKELSVSLYTPPIPPPSYENKIVIKGLKPTTTQDCLFNFIEAKSGCIPETIDYHAEQEDVVMVTFSENPDFQKLEDVFRRTKLEEASLKLYPVPVSSCIIVANLASEVTKDTIEFYFENTRKSGGGQVEKVVMNEDDTCIVYFADYTIIEKVLERTHTLGGQKLDVKRYQECLGRPEGEIAERILHVPEDFVLKDVDPQKIKFMKHSSANRSALEAQLDTVYTKICWPDETGHVVLTCTITKEVKDCFKLVKQWNETAEQNFRDFMKNIIVNKVPVLQDIWSKVMEELKTVTINNPEAVAIFVDKNECVITAVGNKHVTESLSKKVDDITKKVMEEVEKEREKIKEVLTTLKLIETKMLLADKFPTEMEKIFPDLKVKINQNKNEIVFEGPLGQVRDAKLKMYEMKSRFAAASIDKISDLAAGMFLLKQTKEHIVKKLKASHLTAVWDIIDGGLVVYSTSDEQIQHCLSVIRESVIENTIALKKASKTVVNSEGWQTKVDELHAHHTGKSYIKVPEDASKVQICATDDISNEIVDSVKKFLRLNTVTEVKVTCTKNVHRLIERHHKTELQNTAKRLQHSHVQIVSIPGYGGFEVHGTEDGIQEARSDLLALLKRVQQREHILSKPGLAEHMQTPKGKDNLNTIESTLACVVSVKGDDYAEEIIDDPYDAIPADSEVNENIGIKGLKIIGYCKAYDCRNIYTAEGDMTELTVGMIVNSADDKLSLTGGLGKALVQKGGKEIQKECTDYINDEGRLDDGDAFVSTAGKLKADFIVHVRGPVWKGGMKKEDEMLTEAVFKCLQQASARSLTSVAMPAISCGTYG
ncbi:protein mono-ADP-ribosyltransferase PARP14-like, partial [Mercenaria mercenaria]|uniref:protein mono-ADP-ribosyltransferase PARP14-like n=1 Tax=Mercenaria mercenaria TaxID=6596 RepID=UPI00234EC4E1